MPQDVEPDDDPEIGRTRMSLGEHLEELRKRLFRGVLALLATFVVAWILQRPIIELVVWPFQQGMGWLYPDLVADAEEHLAQHPELAREELFESADPAEKELKNWDPRLSVTTVNEGFFFQVKVCAYVALVAGGPFLLWQVWQFIGAGLYKRERRAILRYFPASVVLFVAGASFSFAFVVPYCMYYLNSGIPVWLARPVISIGEYLGFLTAMCFWMGVTWQLPVIMTFLARFGLVQPKTFARLRAHWVVGALVIAAIVTPPDIYSQLMMAVPMIVLYELGILCARLAAAPRPAAG
jgi:sec-independent protein translocase protein TatC